MKDDRASADKLRRDAADYLLISNLATDPDKREMFAKLSQHLNALADEIERAMKALANQVSK